MKEKNDSEKEEDSPVESDLPVDGGYAWVIVFAASMILFLILGSLKCFGVFYVELARKYNVSSKEIQSIQSLTGFFYLGLGPLASALSLRFTNRAVILVGGILSGTGFFLTAFAPSIGYFYLTYGCLTGIGYGLSFGPTILSFVHYFQKRRTLANGIVTAGACFGAVVLPILMRYLMDVTTLQDCMMIFGGILFNICVFACLLRPHDNYPIKKRKKKRKIPARSQTSVDQQSIVLLDASDLIHCDDKSCISVDARSQNSFLSEGDYLLRNAQRKAKHGSKMANASVISLKSFNPSLCTNPESIGRSVCSDDQTSIDIYLKGEKQMTASVISLKSFDPSVCSNPEIHGKSVCSDDRENNELGESFKYENSQMNASVISLKSFDPSVCSNIEGLAKSGYSEDIQSIGVVSLGDGNRKQSLGVASIDSVIKETLINGESPNSESQTAQDGSIGSESKVKGHETGSSAESQGKDDVNSVNIEICNMCDEQDRNSETETNRLLIHHHDNQKQVLPKQPKGKRRQYSAGSSSLKASLSNSKYKIEEETRNQDDSKSVNSYKAEREFLLRNIHLKREMEKQTTASVISLKSYDPSLCASLGVMAGISMQSIPQDIDLLGTTTRKTDEPKATPNDSKLKKLCCVFDWTLFKNPIFLLYLVFIFCESMGYLSLFNILPPFAEEIGGSDRQGAFIISIISISELFGRLFFGWFSYMFSQHRKVSYLTATVLMGLGIVLTPNMRTYLHLGIFCGIYGFFTGGYNGVLFSTIASSLGLEAFAHAFGFITFSASLSLLINPVESGWIKDTTDSWESVFRINGSIALFGCVVLFIIMMLERKKSAVPVETDVIEMDTTVEL